MKLIFLKVQFEIKNTRVDLRYRWEMDFFNENNFSKTFIFRPIRIREKRKKIKVKYSSISALETASQRTLTTMKFLSYSAHSPFVLQTVGQYSTCTDTSLLWNNFHLILLQCWYSQGRMTFPFHSCHQVKPVSTAIWPPNGNWVCGQSSASLL